MALCLFSINAFAQSWRAEPAPVLQGQALKVFGDRADEQARFRGRTIRLFAQADGTYLGLMPVPVLLAPGQYPLEWLDQGGSVLHSAPVVVRSAHYATQNVVLSKALTQLKSSPDEREEVSAFMGEVSPQRFWTEPLEPPVRGCLTSPFGVQRLHNGKPTGDFHAGLDQRGALGSPIRAITPGVVKLTRQYSLRGGTVAIDHGQGLESIYLHMSKITAKDGERVAAGTVIGYVGSTGRSTGPHLHWTLYANGEPINPLQWMKLAPCPGAAPKRSARRVASPK